MKSGSRKMKPIAISWFMSFTGFFHVAFVILLLSWYRDVRRRGPLQEEMLSSNHWFSEIRSFFLRRPVTFGNPVLAINSQQVHDFGHIPQKDTRSTSPFTPTIRKKFPNRNCWWRVGVQGWYLPGSRPCGWHLRTLWVTSIVLDVSPASSSRDLFDLPNGGHTGKKKLEKVT